MINFSLNTHFKSTEVKKAMNELKYIDLNWLQQHVSQHMQHVSNTPEETVIEETFKQGFIETETVNDYFYMVYEGKTKNLHFGVWGVYHKAITVDNANNLLIDVNDVTTKKRTIDYLSEGWIYEVYQKSIL